MSKFEFVQLLNNVKLPIKLNDEDFGISKWGGRIETWPCQRNLGNRYIGDRKNANWGKEKCTKIILQGATLTQMDNETLE